MLACSRYKVKMIADALCGFPDAVFFQDAIEITELTAVLEKVSDGKYDYFFQVRRKTTYRLVFSFVFLIDI